MVTDEENEAAANLLGSELVTFARQLERGLCSLFTGTSTTFRKDATPFEPVKVLRERSGVVDEVMPFDEEHGEREQLIVRVHNAEEVPRIALGKYLEVQRAGEQSFRESEVGRESEERSRSPTARSARPDSRGLGVDL